MFDMDSYYEAFDVHGDIVECSQCGTELDSLYVAHWGHAMGTNGVEEAVPICDRCYWDEVAAKEFGSEDSYEFYDD